MGLRLCEQAGKEKPERNPNGKGRVGSPEHSAGGTGGQGGQRRVLTARAQQQPRPTRGRFPAVFPPCYKLFGRCFWFVFFPLFLSLHHPGGWERGPRPEQGTRMLDSWAQFTILGPRREGPNSQFHCLSHFTAVPRFPHGQLESVCQATSYQGNEFMQ